MHYIVELRNVAHLQLTVLALHLHPDITPRGGGHLIIISFPPTFHSLHLSLVLRNSQTTNQLIKLTNSNIDGWMDGWMRTSVRGFDNNGAIVIAALYKACHGNGCKITVTLNLKLKKLLSDENNSGWLLW